MTPYRAPAWLPGGHAQTIWPVARQSAPPAYRRERWETPDGDFIDVDWLAAAEEAGAPLVVLFHGLEGSSASHYAGALMQALADRGWSGAVPHFRGCSGEPNRLPRAYHSGDSDEIDWVLRRLRALFPQRTIFAVGISLGGNALLKWAGEQEGAARDVVQAVAGVCAPLDLTAAGLALQQGFSLVYAKRFLVTLKAGAGAKLARFPGLFDEACMRAARVRRRRHGADPRLPRRRRLLAPRQRQALAGRHPPAGAGAQRVKRSFPAAGGAARRATSLRHRHARLPGTGRACRFRLRPLPRPSRLAAAAAAGVFRRPTVIRPSHDGAIMLHSC